jgi:Mor family transcriptional regulator
MSDQGELFNPVDADPMDLLSHLGDRVPDRRLWPENLANLFEVMQAYNLRQRLDPLAAALDARDRCIVLGEYCGGRQYYIPTGEPLRIALRDAIIFHESRRGNNRAMAKRFGLTERQIFHIVAEQTRLFIELRQGKLFH